MKRALITVIAVIFTISFCMAQNLPTTKPTQQPTVPTVTVTSEGTVIRGATLTAKLDWLDRNAESHNTYIVEASTNENIAPRTIEYKGAINITVMIRSDYENRIIRLSTNGTMFTVKSNVTFILDNNITLQGHSQNTGSMVDVNGGVFKMNRGSTITGNNGSGVYVRSGTFEMNGGTISGNTASNGGGVFVHGIFTMNNGTISSNTASNGGGVYVHSGTFTLNSGTISGNSAAKGSGGGVYINYGTLEMINGTISDNTAKNSGGGVYAVGGYSGTTFTMRNGVITNNIAGEYGGGVCGSLTKTGGTITGYNSDPTNGNAVRDDKGVLARRGHAVFVNENMRKEKNAASHINLSSNNKENWDQ